MSIYVYLFDLGEIFTNDWNDIWQLLSLLNDTDHSRCIRVSRRFKFIFLSTTTLSFIQIVKQYLCYIWL